MARFTRERTATLSDGSVLTFRRPRQTNVNNAQAVWMKNLADTQDAFKRDLTPSQLEEHEAGKKLRMERQLAKEESKSSEKNDGFVTIHHATLINDTVISWLYGEDPAVEVSPDGSNPYEDVDADVLEEAARAIYDTYVGRKNS